MLPRKGFRNGCGFGGSSINDDGYQGTYSSSYDGGKATAQKADSGNGVSYVKFTPEKFHYSNNYGKSRATALTIDSRVLRAVLVLAVIVPVAYRSYVFSMQQTNTVDRLQYVSNYVHGSLNNVWEYVSDFENNSQFLSILCGLGMAIFSWILVYLDSNIPGIHPPLPVSPKSKYRNGTRKTSIHLGYITALASGFVVSALMMHSF